MSITDTIIRKINTTTNFDIKSLNVTDVALTQSSYTDEVYPAQDTDVVVYSGQCVCVVFSDDPVTYYFIPKNIVELEERVVRLKDLGAPEAVIEAQQNLIKFYQIMSEFGVYQ